jgi:HEPN domain-containing protein
MRDREPEPWLDRAAQDLDVARILTHASNPVRETAAHHLQQAGEKLVKGLLVAMGRRPPRSHDLGTLIDLVPPAEVAQLKLDGLRDLTAYFGAFRYPDFSPPIDVPSTEELDDWHQELERRIALIRSRIDSEGRWT